MQFWYNVNPNSPWMNRCGLTSGKKSLVTAQNQTMIKKKNQGVQQRNELDTGAELEVFPGQAIKKKIFFYPPPKRDWRRLSHTRRAVHRSLAVFLAFFLLRFFGAPEAVLFRPKLGSDCSGAPSSRRLPTPPHNN